MAKNEHNHAPLQEHMLATYGSLRKGLAILAVLFPIGLYFIGKWVFKIDLQESMSAYYFAVKDQSMCSTFPMRAFFVGTLCAISAGLYLYKGFSKLENVLMNTAAISGVVVAVWPERLGAKQVETCTGLKEFADVLASNFPFHYIAAVLMFVCLAVVVWRCASQTLALLPPQHRHREKRFRWTYKLIAILMLVFPIAGIVVNYVLGRNSAVFFIEALGIWTFAWYWFVKSREMRLSDAESKVIERKATTQPAAAAAGLGEAPPLRAV